MIARDVMVSDVQMLAPDETIQAAAQVMAEIGQDALPIGGAEGLQGILTARDVLYRVVAEGLDPAATPVARIMSMNVVSCGPDVPVEEVRRQMVERQIRRMPVLDDGKFLGLVSLDEIARRLSPSPPSDTTGAEPSAQEHVRPPESAEPA